MGYTSLVFTLNNYSLFLDSVFEELTKIEVDVSSYQLDHISYRTNSTKEYEEVQTSFLAAGTQVVEKIIRDRRISIYKLVSPLVYKELTIEALELMEKAPQDTHIFPSGFEHAEFVIDCSLNDLLLKYPKLDWNKIAMYKEINPDLILTFDNGLSVKFHTHSILEVALL